MEEILQNTQPKKHRVGFWILLISLLVALAAIAWLVWLLFNWQAERATLLAEKQKLQDQVAALTQQLAGTTTQPDPACSAEVTDILKANIQAAVESHNYAALEPSMATSVRVILAASDGIGDRTPSQAVADMAYLSGGTTPWNFTLPAATIAAWDASFYGDYFDDNTYAGRATNGMVVVFDFDNCAKINEVFMAANEELLL